MSQKIIHEQVFEADDLAQSKFLTPFQRKVLLKNLQGSLKPEYRRRLEIMLLADMGKTQTQICQRLGCSQEMARYWIALAQAGLAHKWNERPFGRPKMADERYVERLKELVTLSPRDCGYPFGQWTARWLSKHLAKELEIEVSDRHINRLLKQMGLSTKQKPVTLSQSEQSKEASIRISDLQSNLQSNLQPSFYWSSVNSQ
jgi:transposase